MSQKLQVQFSQLGRLDSMTNAVELNGVGCQELLNAGDLEGRGQIETQPGFRPEVESHLVASVSLSNVDCSQGAMEVYCDDANLLTAANPRDFFRGPDGEIYTIDVVNNDGVGDTSPAFLLKTPYRGETVTASTAEIIYRAWLIDPYYSPVAAGSIKREQDYTGTTTAGTFGSGAQAYPQGVGLAASFAPTSYYPGPGGTKYYNPFYGSQGHEGVFDSESIIYTSKYYRTQATRFTISAGTYPGVWLRWQIYNNTFPAGQWAFLDALRAATVRISIRTGTTHATYGPIPDMSAGGLLASCTTKFNSIVARENQGISGAYFPFASDWTAVGGTQYWITVENFNIALAAAANSSVYARFVVSRHTNSNTLTGISYNYLKCTRHQFVDGTWSGTALGPGPLSFFFHLYPTTRKSYVSEIFDLGLTPNADGELNITRASYVRKMTMESRYFLFHGSSSSTYTLSSSSGFDSNQLRDALSPSWLNADNTTTDPLEWTLRGSNSLDTDGTLLNPVQIGSARQTALTAVIPAASGVRFRYYQITYEMRSYDGHSTPLLAGAYIKFPQPNYIVREQNLHKMVGIHNQMLRTIERTPVSISSTEVALDHEVPGVMFQQEFFWTTGGDKPKYWDGSAAAPAYIEDHPTQNTSPSLCRNRGNYLTLYGDKLFIYQGVTVQDPSNFFRTSRSINPTGDTIRLTMTLTGAPADYVGYRFYPNIEDQPRRYFIVTSVDSGMEYITCAAQDMSSVYDGTGNKDAFLGKFKNKTTWFSRYPAIIGSPTGSPLVTAAYGDPGDWHSGDFYAYDEDDGDVLQHISPHKGRMLAVCRNNVWMHVGMVSSVGMEKVMLSEFGGTFAPASVVDTGDSSFWWGVDGIYRWTGGYGAPEIISQQIRRTIEDIEPALKDQVTGVFFRGKIYWSWATKGSGTNNRTLVYNPLTGTWLVRSFGMISPQVFVENGEDYILFQATGGSTTGYICRYPVGRSFPNGDQQVTATTSFIASSDPTERAQWISAQMVIEFSLSDQTADPAPTATLSVSYALDYNSTGYTEAGQLQPITSQTSGRTNINHLDQVYEVRFPKEAIGSSISLRISGSTPEDLKIKYIRVICDPVEAQTKK